MKTLLNAIRSIALLGLLGLLSAPALAQTDLVGHDTDLFLVNPNIPSGVPNVLIVLDNTANWSSQSQHWPSSVDAYCSTNLPGAGNQQGDAEVCAIHKVVSEKVGQNVNIGFMMYVGSPDSGGYVRFPMSTMNDTNKTAFKNTLKVIWTNAPAEKSPASASPSIVMNDAFRYFNSLGTYTGKVADSPGSGDPDSAVANVGGYTNSSMTQFNFPTPANDNSCGYDYIIFIGNGMPSKDAAAYATTDLGTAAALLNDTAVTANTTVLQNTGVNPDVWSRFMYQYGKKVANGVYRHITTYTIDVCKDQCSTSWATILTSMANVSNGEYYRATTLEAIEFALGDIFQKVQAVNTVFAATTLPVSINVRGTNLNQVYIGVFRPDAQLSPRWFGNLKHYKLGVTSSLINGVPTERLELQDANAARAVNLNTGFIANTATSIWSETKTPAGTGYWAFRSPNYAINDAGKDQDAPDGDLVEKGGVAQKIRQFYPTPDPSPDTTPSQWRKIYTCTGSCTSGSALKDFLFTDANADISSTKLGTLVTSDVNSLTASGQTVTATISSGHSFVVGNQVVISQVKPTLYGGTFTVLTAGTYTFTYSLSPVTPDASTAVVSLPAYALNTATDTVTVASSTPTAYNVTAATITAVVGSSGNQFSYAMSGSASTTAAGYSVTGNRRPASIVWSSATGLATVSLTKHGYSTTDAVTISGASPADFNVPGTDSGVITKIDDNSFTYQISTTPAGGSTTSAIATLNGHTFTSADSVVITGASGNFNTASTGSSVTGVTANTFTYTTSGTVSGSATGTIVAKKRIAADLVTYNVSSASIGTGGNKDKITLTIGAGTNLTSGQLPPTLAVGDRIAIMGVTCTETSGKTTTTRTCSTTTTAPTTGGTPGTAPFTGTITAVGTNTVTFAASGNVDTVTLSSAKVYWTGATLSTGVTLTSVAAGSVTVTATGTIVVKKTGDLTSKVTSISSNAVASGDPTIKAALAGSADPNERANLIDWVRGRDNKDNEDLNGVTTDVRASVHGDVLHSRPAVVNYNRNGDDDDVFVFYGTNDGLLRAVKGGSLASGGGKEQWAFVAEDHFSKLKRLRDQSPRISSLTPRDDFFDGSISVYTLDANRNGKLVPGEGDKVYLFITQRRGGRMMYALDVTDPLNPKLLWKKGCTKPTGTGLAGGCDTGFDEIGQTWSQPQLGYLRNWPDKLAVIFAAGYDAGVEDFQACAVTAWSSASVTAKTGVVMPVTMNTASCPPTGGTATTVSRSMGRGIFVLDAATGVILWRAGPDASAQKQVSGMDYAMPADIAAFRNRSNTASRASSPGDESVASGYFDRLYATDTGGNVWRVDVADVNTSVPGGTPDYLVTKLASIAVAPAGGTHAALNYRKFPFSPDVVYSSDDNGQYDAVLVGTGDREKPFDMVVKNRFYMFKDRNTSTMTSSSTVPAAIVDTSSSTDLFDATSNCLQDATKCSTSGDNAIETAQLRDRKGWKLDLANLGEKTVATATTAAGTVLFNTFEPKEDTVTGLAGNTGSNASTNFCTGNLGTARQYALNFENAKAADIFGSLPANFVPGDHRFAFFAGGGFLPTPVPVLVKIGDKYFQSVISGVQTTDPGGLKLQSRVRTYWYRKTD